MTMYPYFTIDISTFDFYSRLESEAYSKYGEFENEEERQKCHTLLGRFDFRQFLRYTSSTEITKLRRRCLELVGKSKPSIREEGHIVITTNEIFTEA